MRPALVSRIVASQILGLGLLLVSASESARGQATTERVASGEARRIPEVLNFANGLVKERRYNDAAEEYERFLKDVPNGPDAIEARYGLANTRLFLGQYQEARKQFDQFLKLAPSHPNAPTAWFRVGEMAYVLGDLPAARKALEAYTSLGASAGHRFLDTAWPYLGEVCFALGDMPAARLAFERAERDFPKGRQADRSRYGLARALAAQNETDAAVKLFDDLARAGGPEWTEKARFQIGVAFTAASKFNEAAEAFVEMERSAPRSALVPEARLRRAEALLNAGRRQEAERLLRPLASEAPRNLAVQAGEALGSSLWERGQIADARAAWDAALKRSPAAPIAAALLMRLAEADRKEEKTADARARYLKVLEEYRQDPAAPVALIRAAGLTLEGGDAAAAKKLVSSFAARFPAHPLLSDAHLIEARAALVLKQPKAAIALIEAEEKPSPDARYVLGRAYQEDGQKEKGDAIIESLAQAPESGSASTDARFLIGQKRFDSENFAAALPPLQKYLADKPKGDVAADALAYVGFSQAKLGHDDDSRAALERLIKEFPQAKALAWLRLSLASLRSEQQDFANAAELLRPVAEGAPSEYRARAQSDLGWALLLGGKPADAAGVFDSLVKSAPTDPLAAEAARGRARALDAAGKVDESLRAYEQVMETYAASPEAATAALARARLLVRAKRPDDASSAYERYLKDFAKSGPEPPDAALAEWGSALLEAGNAKEADQVYRRLLDQYPNSPRMNDARVQLAVSAHDAGKRDAVIPLLEPVVAVGSKASASLIQSALFLLGRTQTERQDWAAALKAFTRLAADYPDGLYVVEARFWKAESLFKGGAANADDAQAAASEFAALADEFKASEKSADLVKTARLRRIQCWVLVQRWEEVLAAADALKPELSKNDSRLSDIEFARGRALQGQALPKFDDARAAFDYVIKARPGTELAARAQLMRGETFFHQKDYAEAVREFLKVAVLYKNAPRWQALALLEAGKVEELRGRWSDAADLYEKLRTKFPDDPNVPEANRRFEQAKAKTDGSPNE